MLVANNSDGDGLRVSLTYGAGHEHDNCGIRQETPVQFSSDRVYHTDPLVAGALPESGKVTGAPMSWVHQ